jgi:hypothetical protein
LTTYAHDSQVQVIRAPPLISTIHKSPQHPLSLFPVCYVFTSRSWQRLLTVEILKLHALMSFLLSLPCRTKLSFQLTLSLAYNISVRTDIENTVLSLLLSCPLPRERIYRAVTQKRPQSGPQKTPFFYCCVHYLATAAIYRVTA